MSVAPGSAGQVARSTLVVVGIVAACAAVYVARGVLVLIFFGALAAVCVEPVVAALGRRGMRRGGAVALIVLAAVLALVLAVLLLVIPASRQVGALLAELPERLNAVSERLGGQGSSTGRFLGSDETADILGDGTGRAVDLVTGAVSGVFGAVGSVLGACLSVFSAAAVAVYLSLAMPRLRAAVDRMVKKPSRSQATDDALSKVSAYVIGQSMICLVAGVCAYVFFQIAGVPYPAVLAIVVLVLDAVPQVGATLASVAAIAVALSVSWPLAVATTIYFLVYQQLENYLVAPRVFAKAVDITPLGAFLSVLVGSAVGGLLGAVLALPLAGAAKVVVRQVLDERSAEAASVPVPQVTSPP